MERDESKRQTENEGRTPSEKAGNDEDGTQTAPAGDESGKPTIDEPTGPALDPGPDEFDKQAEDA